MAEITLSDGNTLVISGYGTKSRVSQKCLRADVIQQLTNSNIPDDVKKQTCYWVLLASTDSSDISKAVTEFIRADDEFQKKIQALAAPEKTEPLRGPASLQPTTEPTKPEKEIAVRLLTSAVLLSQEQLVSEAKNLPDAQKPAVKTEIGKLVKNVKDAEIKNKLDAVIGGI
ncbi:MAG: hypothetical protein WC855_11510 [Thermodesulfovibrionales bacterium]